MVEHCKVNTQAMGANPVEVPKFFQVYLQLLKLQLPLQQSYLNLKKDLFVLKLDM